MKLLKFKININSDWNRVNRRPLLLSRVTSRSVVFNTNHKWWETYNYYLSRSFRFFLWHTFRCKSPRTCWTRRRSGRGRSSRKNQGNARKYGLVNYLKELSKKYNLVKWSLYIILLVIEWAFICWYFCRWLKAQVSFFG